MERRSKKGPAPKVTEPQRVDQLPGQIDAEPTDLRRGVQAISTPREAVEAMLAAGAVFAIQRRADVLGVSFTYSMAPSGDIERARAILAVVKAKPPAFMAGFKMMVQQVAGPIE